MEYAVHRVERLDSTWTNDLVDPSYSSPPRGTFLSLLLSSLAKNHGSDDFEDNRMISVQNIPMGRAARIYTATLIDSGILTDALNESLVE